MSTRVATPLLLLQHAATQTFAVSGIRAILRFALEIGRRFDPRSVPDVEAGMPEQPGHEGPGWRRSVIAARKSHPIAALIDISGT